MSYTLKSPPHPPTQLVAKGVESTLEELKKQKKGKGAKTNKKQRNITVI
jgi:hypothetical protein